MATKKAKKKKKATTEDKQTTTISELKTTPVTTIDNKNNNSSKPQPTLRTAIDKQTGREFILEPEKKWDIIAATFSALYLFVALYLIAWTVFDLYHGQNQVLSFIFSENTIYPDSTLARLIAYSALGLSIIHI